LTDAVSGARSLVGSTRREGRAGPVGRPVAEAASRLCSWEARGDGGGDPRSECEAKESALDSRWVRPGSPRTASRDGPSGSRYDRRPRLGALEKKSIAGLDLKRLIEGRFQPRELNKHLSRGSQLDRSTLGQEQELLYQAWPWSGLARFGPTTPTQIGPRRLRSIRPLLCRLERPTVRRSVDRFGPTTPLTM
jgi:hypothetical protein